MGAAISTALFGLFATAAVTLLWHQFGPRNPKTAPGPRGLPLIGNLLDVPSDTKGGAFLYYRELAKKFGDIIQLNMMGEPMLILNHLKDAEEILGKRSAHFSSRRPMMYSNRYRAEGRRLVMLEYNNDLKKQRQAFQEMMNPRSVATYESLMEQESIKLLADILITPPDSSRQSSGSLRIQMKRYIANLIFTLTYGKKLASDKNLMDVLHVLDDLLTDTAPGAHLVDSFPVLDYLPDFLSPWRQRARAKFKFDSSLYLRLARDVRAGMKAGTATECFAANLWEQHDLGKFDELTLAYVAGTAFEASIHTTSATLMWFSMAMRLYPEVQEKARKEIEDLLIATNGHTSEPPTLAMLSQLPYCVALIKETMRWMPSAPGAFPHYSTSEQSYKDYTIQKGTIVFPNVFSMHHDPRNYTEPDAFHPERFMSAKNDLTSHEVFTEGHNAFGFGRRICPARYLGAKVVFIGAVRMLWAFDFKPLTDVNGEPMHVSPYESPFSTINEPHDFPIQVTPRSEKHAKKIMSDWEDVQESWKHVQREA